MEIENSSGKFAAFKKTPVAIPLSSVNEDSTMKTREENISLANMHSRYER